MTTFAQFIEKVPYFPRAYQCGYALVGVRLENLTKPGFTNHALADAFGDRRMISGTWGDDHNRGMREGYEHWIDLV